MIRGGYGITYFGGQFDNINILQLNPPDDPSFTLVNGTCGYCTTPNAPVATLANPFHRHSKPQLPNIVSLPNPDTHRTCISKPTTSPSPAILVERP